MKQKIPRNVFLLGLVSFFNDIASEMIYPIIPIFLTSVLHAPVSVVGMIEGIAEFTASIGKFIFGVISDYFGRRKPFVLLGYTVSAVSKILIGLATSWPLVLFARFFDRTGKGLRTAARDSLLLANTNPQNKGFIFGFHRAFDSLGAVIGPVIALILLYFLKDNIRLVFLLAFIPAILAVLLLFVFVKEKKRDPQEQRRFVPLSWGKIDTRLKIFLFASFIFAIGNSSDTFILLRAKGLGFTTTMVVLVYVFYNLSQTIFATPAGSLSDRIGAKNVFMAGLAVFSLVYFVIAIIKDPVWLWLIFPLYGIYIAATDGVSKAYISQFINEKESATFFGLHQTLLAIGAFLASFIGGILWTNISPNATFYYGSLMAASAFVIFLLFHPKKAEN